MPTMRLKQDLTVEFKGHTLNLPRGLRCVQITRGGTVGKYWIDEFPLHIFPAGSILKHDAIHYGIVIGPEMVEEAP